MFQYRYQQVEITVNHNRFLGYTKDEDGHLIIEPTEEEVVKRIFKEYLDGSSLIQIARNLEAYGVLTGAGNKKWAGTTAKGTLVNEKYMGDARTILEEDLKQAVVDGINKVFADESRIKEVLNTSIRKLLKVDNIAEVETIDSQMQVLQQQLLEKSNRNQEVTDIVEQIIQLKEQKQNILLGKAVNDNSKERMDEMIEFIDLNGHDGLDYDEVLVRRLIEQVIIYDDCINIKFKSGIEIEVQC